MYVLFEYLTYMVVVSVLGLVLFGATALGLAAKEGATKLREEVAEKLPQLAARLSPGHLADFKNFCRAHHAHRS